MLDTDSDEWGNVKGEEFAENAAHSDKKTGDDEHADVSEQFQIVDGCVLTLSCVHKKSSFSTSYDKERRVKPLKLSYEAGCKARTAAVCLRPTDNSPFGRHLTNSLLLFKIWQTHLPEIIIQRLEKQVNRIFAIRCFQLFQPSFQHIFIETAMMHFVKNCR